MRGTSLVPVQGQERLTALYRAHGVRLYGYAARRCLNGADAADVVAEVFTTAWRRIGEVPDHDDQALLWLYGVARLTLSNHHRGDRRRDRLGATLQAAFVEQHGADPADLITGSDRDDLVHRALRRLPEQDRELLTLITWEGLSTADAATVLGITPVATRARIVRARRRFAQLYALCAPAPENHPTGALKGTT